MANLATIAMLADFDGLLLVDKPANISAHDTLKAVKTRFNLAKAGHGGTLEPNATGLMVILLGDATRFSNDIMARDRAYEMTVRLGRTTDTRDREGRTLAENDFSAVTAEKLEAALPELRGDIFQTSPPFSVFKRPDEAGYGIMETAKEDATPRLVHVYRLKAEEFAPPLVKFSLIATKGLCARELAHQLGELLGCGACLEELRRTKVAKFGIEGAMPLMELLKLDGVEMKSRAIPMAGALL